MGNLNSQRGSFIFFYKFLYNWKTLSLSCHLISEKFDTGILICQKFPQKKKILPLEIMNLYNENYDFIFKSIDIILKKKLLKKNRQIWKAKYRSFI